MIQKLVALFVKHFQSLADAYPRQYDLVVPVCFFVILVQLQPDVIRQRHPRRPLVRQLAVVEYHPHVEYHVVPAERQHLRTDS